jgi:3-hydroxyacyl-CoA dehydrogenase
MAESEIETVACVGTGVIGRSWIQVFSGAGCRTRIYDASPEQVKNALVWFEEALEQDIADGIVTANEAEARRSLVSAHDNLKEAVRGAEYIQESATERLDIKRNLYAELDRIAPPAAILASSTSALDINDIAAGLPGISRCIMAHPFNPPHVIPVVEVLPTKQTRAAVTTRTMAFLKHVGSRPVLLNSYVTGFLGNRIQAAVVREAIHLVERGIGDVEAVDAVICHGLGLRWALLGSFGVNNTNADGGVREYYRRFGNTYEALINALDSTTPSFTPDMIERIARGVDAMEGDSPTTEICKWRDRLVRKIRDLKEKDPHP